MARIQELRVACIVKEIRLKTTLDGNKFNSLSLMYASIYEIMKYVIASNIFIMSETTYSSVLHALQNQEVLTTLSAIMISLCQLFVGLANAKQFNEKQEKSQG